jgi:cyclopropane-fatty-acyl-phospholipid synthase
VVGVTISRRQVEFAREHVGDLPVEIRLQDYRSLDETFDRIVSVGMIEHVGHRNHGTFMRVARRCLAPEGLMLLHTIGANHSSHRGDPWIDRYIFPDGVLPSMSQLARAAEHRFVLEDWHGFGPDYDRTLMAWHRNVVTRWSELADRYDDRFYRMWTYYLLACAGAFRARKNQLWQLVLSPEGVVGGYLAPRRVGTSTEELAATDERATQRARA